MYNICTELHATSCRDGVACGQNQQHPAKKQPSLTGPRNSIRSPDQRPRLQIPVLRVKGGRSLSIILDFFVQLHCRLLYATRPLLRSYSLPRSHRCDAYGRRTNRIWLPRLSNRSKDALSIARNKDLSVERQLTLEV
jgi:hypothetical protein